MAPGWWRLVSGAGFGLMVVAAVAVATAGRWHGLPAWGTAVLAGLAVAGGPVLDPLKKLTGEWIEQPRRRRRALEAHLRMRDRRGRPRRVRDCRDTVTLGVHPATTEGGGAGRQPPYVRRDAHDALRRAFEDGGLVVIEGRSAAGKSWLAYEVMHAYAPGWWLVVPETPRRCANCARPASRCARRWSGWTTSNGTSRRAAWTAACSTRCARPAGTTCCCWPRCAPRRVAS